MTKLDLTIAHDGRFNDFPDGYDSNRRMSAFSGSWKKASQSGGANTWSHAGVYCRQRFGKLKKQERRLVYLGMLVAYINGDRCSHWTDEQKDKALKTAWKLIDKNRK